MYVITGWLGSAGGGTPTLAKLTTAFRSGAHQWTEPGSANGLDAVRWVRRQLYPSIAALRSARMTRENAYARPVRARSAHSPANSMLSAGNEARTTHWFMLA
jgi:hypothetical protein